MALHSSHFTAPDGAQIAYTEALPTHGAERAASLPAFVLLHPMPVDHRFWLPMIMQINQLYRDNLHGQPFRYILPDLRGHGRSTLGKAEANIPQMAADVIALLDSLGVKEAIFAGCSIGGYVLFEIWRQRPDLVSAMAFLCSKPQPDTDANRISRAETIAKIQTGGTAYVAEFFDYMARTMTGDTTRVEQPEITARLRGMMSFTPEALIAVVAAIRDRADSRPLLPTITVPVLAVAGGEDAGIPPDEVREIAELAPHVDFQLVEKAGHYAPYEVPEIMAEIVSEWLEKTSA
jgi:pimeloyl-ACP methyl ester carboxylesterase